MFSPDGTLGDVPHDRVKDALAAGGKMGLDMIAPDGTPGVVPIDRVHDAIRAGGTFKTAAPAGPAIDMSQSWAPKIVRGVATALPAVGGTAGGILGAGAGGVGAIGGAGVGSVLGEEGRQAINQGLAVNLPARQAIVQGKTVNLPANQYGEQPLSPEQSARNIFTAGALGAGGQALGGAAIGLGSNVLEGIAARQAVKESGDAAQALLSSAPVGFSRQGLQSSLAKAFNSISGKLTDVLSGSTQTAPLDAVVQPSRVIASQSALPGVANKIDKIITAAKEVAGIQGNDASPSQLLSFAQQIAKPNLYSGNPGPLKAVTDNILKTMYGHVSQAVKVLEPDSAPLLDQLTNLHAATSAIKNYAPGPVKSALVTAATHPMTTAAVSPYVTAAGAYYWPKAKEFLGQAAREFLP
jgi:hypothetical protein